MSMNQLQIAQNSVHSQDQLNQLQAQGIQGSLNNNCIQQQSLGSLGYHYQQQYPNTVYVDRPVPADVLVDKVENGFVVVIKGKKYVAVDAAAIAGLIAVHFVDKK